MTRIITYFAVALVCFFLSSLQTLSQTFVNCQLDENITQTYRSNRDTVLSNLRNRSSLGTYSNATAGLSPNTVYGMYLCRGDINRTSCSNCVQTLLLDTASFCNSHKGGYIERNGECMVQYSNFSFFTLVEDVPSSARCYPSNSLDSAPHFFNQTLPGKIDELIIRASSPLLSPVPYFVEDQEHVTQLEGSYDLEAMAQCSPDLDPRNCTVCLRLAMDTNRENCRHAQSALIVFPKCLVKYNITTLQTSLGVSVTKGNGIFGRTFIAIMTALVLALMGL